MAGMIKDGTGKGYLMKVDSDHRALVSAVTQNDEAYFSEKGDMYSIETGLITLTDTSEHKVLWIKNTATTQYLYIASVVYSWNGGSTNHNRTLFGSCYRNPGDPTANHEAYTPLQLNWTSGSAALATTYRWDGVGTGMTVTGGSQCFFITTIGRTVLTNSLPIMGTNDIYMISVQGEEVGTVGVTIRFYYKDVE